MITICVDRSVCRSADQCELIVCSGSIWGCYMIHSPTVLRIVLDQRLRSSRADDADRSVYTDALSYTTLTTASDLLCKGFSSRSISTYTVYCIYPLCSYEDPLAFHPHLCPYLYPRLCPLPSCTRVSTSRPSSSPKGGIHIDGIDGPIASNPSIRQPLDPEPFQGEDLTVPRLVGC